MLVSQALSACGSSWEVSVPRWRGEKSRQERSILGPRHALGPAPTHKGTTRPWLIKYSHNSCPSACQATNLVGLEGRLPRGSYGASRQTHTLNNEYTAKWISRILVSGEEGGLLYSKDSVAFNSDWKTNPPTNDVKAGFPPCNSEDLRFHYRKATCLYAWKKRPSKCKQLWKGMWFGRTEANWNNSGGHSRLLFWPVRETSGNIKALQVHATQECH